MKIKILLVNIFLLSGLLFVKDAFSSGVFPDNPRFYHYSLEQGLSNSTVYSITQDGLGFIWIGTTSGLNRFDGYSFKIYKLGKDKRSLNNDSPGNIYYDDDGILWLGTWGGGLNRFDLQADSFAYYIYDKNDPTSLSENRVQTIFKAKDGTLWVGTYSKGLNRKNPGSDKFIHYKSRKKDPKSLSNNRIWAICEDNDGYIWVGTSGGLNKINPENEKIIQFTNKTDKHFLSNNNIRSLFFDSKNNILWVGTLNGLTKLSLKDYSSKKYIVSDRVINKYGRNTINSITDSGTGLLYLATGEGLVIFNSSTGRYRRYLKVENNPFSISDNDLRWVFRDRQGIIWLGTRNHGISKYNPHHKKFHGLHCFYDAGKKAAPRQVLSIYSPRNHPRDIYISSLNGFFHYNPDSDSLRRIYFRNRKLSDFPYRVIAGSNSQPEILWLGGSRLITRYNTVTGKTGVYLLKNKKQGNIRFKRVVSMVVNDDKTLWFGDYGAGLNLLNTETGEIISFLNNPDDPRSISHNEVLSMARADSSHLWLGTGKGLNLFDIREKTFEHYYFKRDKKESNDIRIICISKSSDSLIWLGTDNGLIHFNPVTEAYRIYGDKYGFQDIKIISILIDEKRLLWLSSENGLMVFNPENEQVFNFSKYDGLTNSQYNSGASLKAANGKFFFGGIKGIDFFYPDSIHISKYKPPIILTNIKILTSHIEKNPFSKSVNYLDEISLSYRDHLFAIEFTALDYSEPKKIKYAYKLEGIDKNWIYTDYHNRRITYSFLQGGNYALKIKSTNADGIWNTKAKELKLTIVPPFWQTPLFRFLSIVSIAFIIYLGYKVRIQTINQKNEYLNKINKDLNILIRKKEEAEAKLAKSEHRYRTLFENIPSMYFNIDENLNILSLNPFAAKSMGYKMEELVGNKITTLYLKKDLEKVTHYLRSCLEETDRIHYYQFEKRKKDRSVIWVNEIAHAVESQDGKKEIFLVFEDITAKKIAEEKRKELEEKLIQAQKMEAVGKMAGGIAHDFNNMLLIINGRAELALLNLDKGISPHKDIEAVLEAGEKARLLTRQLLSFSKPQKANLKIVNVDEIIRKLYPLLSNLIDDGIALETKLKAGDAIISVDPVQLEQILLNLVVNAKHALEALQTSSNPGSIIIETGISKKNSEYVDITVRDTGIGMSKKTMSRIFEPFFSTKAPGKSTGLGMAIVYSIIKQNQARIDIKSAEGKGTQITVSWPLYKVDVKPELAKSDSPADEAVPSLSILLVDDEPEVRKFIQTALSSFGHRIHAASNGSEGVSMFRENKELYDIIITDIEMPGVNGIQFMQEVRKEKPHMKFLFVSGYSKYFDEIKSYNRDNILFLQKPFTIIDIRKKIRKLFLTRPNGTP
jgi:PAS domain S-box-containing protein